MIDIASALLRFPLSGEVRHNRPYKSLQGFRVQKSENEMRHAQGVETLQLLDYLCAASGYEVLLGAAHYLVGVFGDAGCTQIGQFDLRRVSTDAGAVAFQDSKLARVLFNCARIEIPPVCPASDYGQRFLFTCAAD